MGFNSGFKGLSKNQSIIQSCKNPGHHVTLATEFCTVAPNICWSSDGSLLHITLLVPTVLR